MAVAESRQRDRRAASARISTKTLVGIDTWKSRIIQAEKGEVPAKASLALVQVVSGA
jgi:hypothetical protein